MYTLEDFAGFKTVGKPGIWTKLGRTVQTPLGEVKESAFLEFPKLDPTTFMVEGQPATKGMELKPETFKGLNIKWSC